MGTCTYRICDPVQFIMDYLNAGEDISADEYIKNLVINAVQQVVYQNNGISKIGSAVNILSVNPY